jgi:hypothetical protein
MDDADGRGVLMCMISGRRKISSGIREAFYFYFGLIMALRAEER